MRRRPLKCCGTFLPYKRLNDCTTSNGRLELLGGKSERPAAHRQTFFQSLASSEGTAPVARLLATKDIADGFEFHVLIALGRGDDATFSEFIPAIEGRGRLPFTVG